MEAKNTIQKLMNQKFHEMINKTDKPLARPRNKIQINEIRNGKWDIITELQKYRELLEIIMESYIAISLIT